MSNKISPERNAPFNASFASFSDALEGFNDRVECICEWASNLFNYMFGDGSHRYELLPTEDTIGTEKENPSRTFENLERELDDLGKSIQILTNAMKIASDVADTAKQVKRNIGYLREKLDELFKEPDHASYINQATIKEKKSDIETKMNELNDTVDNIEKFYRIIQIAKDSIHTNTNKDLPEFPDLKAFYEEAGNVIKSVPKEHRSTLESHLESLRATSREFSVLDQKIKALKKHQEELTGAKQTINLTDKSTESLQRRLVDLEKKLTELSDEIIQLKKANTNGKITISIEKSRSINDRVEFLEKETKKILQEIQIIKRKQEEEANKISEVKKILKEFKQKFKILDHLYKKVEYNDNKTIELDAQIGFFTLFANGDKLGEKNFLVQENVILSQKISELRGEIAVLAVELATKLESIEALRERSRDTPLTYINVPFEANERKFNDKIISMLPRPKSPNREFRVATK